MLLGIPKSIFQIITYSFLVWIILSTVVPQSLTSYLDPQVRSNKYLSPQYPYESLTELDSKLVTNSTIYYVIGHPDDEVMFFAPSFLELNKPTYNNKVKILCLSYGDAVDESFGYIRKSELIHSGEILGADSVTVLNEFKDGMKEDWDPVKIEATLKREIKEKSNVVVVTFDENGVSNHPNHISLHYGVKRYFKNSQNVAMYKLKTLNFLEKYSFTLLTNIELFVQHFSKIIMRNVLRININVSFFTHSNDTKSMNFYSDLNMLSTSYAAMAYGHFSQMVWFRYGWLILSRYLTYNHLIQVN